MPNDIPSKKSDEANMTLDEIKSDFITIASHQLRTPISEVRWSLDTLLTGRVGELTEKQKEVITQAYSSNKFMAKAVNDLLRVARLESKGVTMQPKLTAILPIITEVVRRNRDFARASNCDIVINAEKDLPKAYIDGIQIRPVINALVDNAIRYSRGRCKIIINLKPTKDFLVFSIKDSGIGIPVTQQHMVFSKFFRASNAIKAQSEGMGLDLFVSNQIATLAGGAIGFTSEENKGATFRIYLPLRRAQFDEAAELRKYHVTEDSLRKEREFVSITVHELKAPLSIAKWGLEILKSQTAGKLTADQTELIDRIYRGNERLLVLVRDLLNLAKLQEGKFEIELKVIKFEQLLNDVITGFLAEAKSKNITLSWKRIRDFPKVKADPNRIAQVITNLLSNAIKYTPEGGQVTISMSTKSGSQLKALNEKVSGTISHYDNKAGYLVFSVTDSGIGIAPQDQNKLFSRFFRSQKVMSSEAEGTGLGLYISKSIIELHQGDVWFISRLNQGSTFSFSLPIA